MQLNHFSFLQVKNDLTYPNNVYSNYFINSIYGKRILKPLSRRAGQPHLNAEQIQSMKIINPPVNLQNQFAKIVDQVEVTKLKIEESLKEMDNQFNGLLQSAFK